MIVSILSQCIFASKINVYFTLDDHFRVKEVFIMLLIRREIIVFVCKR